MTAPLALDLIRQLPKAELHCHLDGSLRPTTMLELAAEYGQPMPADQPAALGDFMVVRQARNLEDYLARFSVTLSVMQHARALERIAAELVEDAAADGVRYIEVRFSPILNTMAGLSVEEVLAAVWRGLQRGEQRSGTIARIIVCALRHLPPESSLALAQLAVASREQGVVGFDLAGGERGNPAALHAPAFAYAREHDLAVTVHAGEASGAESVREAVHLCGADRIGHATHLIGDASLTAYVNDRRIPLEVCLTSNVQTHAVPSFEAHPLRAYVDRGLVVTLNTDNRLMSGTTLTDEYWRAAELQRLSLAELGAISVASFESAFLPWRERAVLAARARRDIDVLLAGQGGGGC